MAFFLYQKECSQIHQIRSDFHQISSKNLLYEFIDNFDQSTCNLAQPYLASAKMQRAKYAFFPHKKLTYFNEGKKLLENYIQHNPKNIEARYVRLLVQSQAPFFLGYNSQINDDAAFVLKNISSSGLPESYQNELLKNTRDVISKK